jgi:ferrochelatase
VVDHLAALASRGARAAVLVPAGFVSDHVEVRYDLDIDATAAAERFGIAVARAPAPGTHPRFVAMIRELVVERMSDSAERLTLGALGPSHDVCPAGCCAAR